MKWLDRPIQIAYQLSYPFVLLCWRLAKRSSHGVQVALWVNRHVLLVRNSYRTGYSFPGGDVKTGERSIDAACRELQEETDVTVAPKQLSLAMEIRYENGGISLRDTIFECQVSSDPIIQVDNREVIEARFVKPADALDLYLMHSTRKYLLKHAVNIKAKTH